MATSYNNNKRANQYIYGNVAPQVTNPQRKQERVPERRPRYVKVEKVGAGALATWIIASAILIIACSVLIYSQAKMNNYIDEVSELEAQIAELQAENNLALARINESVDMDQIQQEAERLGMVRLTEDKIIDVDYSGSDYVRQFKNVPDEADRDSDNVLDN